MRDDGVLFVCRLVNASQKGLMPVQVLKPMAKYWFKIRTVGAQRQYLAKGVNEQVDFLLSVPFDPRIQIGNYAVLGNGEQYRITNISHYDEDTEIRRTDLSLTRLEDYYAISTDENCQ